MLKPRTIVGMAEGLEGLHWENITRMGYDAFRKQMSQAGVSVGPWENLTVHERIALMAQAQEIWNVISAAVLA